MHVLAVVGFSQDTALTSVPSGHRESLMQRLGRLASPGPLLLAVTPTELTSSLRSEATTFNPKRFVSTLTTGDEALILPEGAPYMPCVFGPRVCLGKKFSQVEFVGAVAQALSEYRVEILRHDWEREADARARLMGVLDEKYFNIGAHL